VVYRTTKCNAPCRFDRLERLATDLLQAHRLGSGSMSVKGVAIDWEALELIATTNPWPCGYFGDPRRACFPVCDAAKGVRSLQTLCDRLPRVHQRKLRRWATDPTAAPLHALG
jgi:hypothetical protein